ncbi:MAG: Holliday junction resolvase RuvX, partial [bacterium]
MRYLCVDLGDKRTGTATGDTVTGMVGPGEVLEIPIARREGRELVEALAAAARAAGAGGVVVGLRLPGDGTG